MDEKTINGMRKPELLALIKETLIHINEIKSLHEKVSILNKEANQAEESIDAAQQKIINQENEYEKMYGAVEDVYNKICKDKSGQDSIEEKFNILLNELITSKKEINNCAT